MAPVQETNSDNFREIFSIFYTEIVYGVYSLESPRRVHTTYNVMIK